MSKICQPMANAPVDAIDEKLAEEVDPSESTPETTEETIAAETEVEAEEAESPYKKELEKQKLIARQKTGALEEERKRRKEAEAKLKKQEEPEIEEEVEETKPRRKTITLEEADQLLEAKLAKREFAQLVKASTADKDEQELIQMHYENTIKRTGNVEADFEMAAALANAHLVKQAKQQQIEREENEGLVAGFQGGKPTSRAGKPTSQTDPALRAASAILDRLGMGEAKKHLGK